MSRAAGMFAIVAYFAICVAALLYWAPHFFSVNTHIPMEITYRYLAASGVPFALLLISVIARQMLVPAFSMAFLMQALVAGGLLWCALYAFYYPPQANFFASMHLLVCFSMFVVNFYQYRRTLKMRERYAAAEE